MIRPNRWRRVGLSPLAETWSEGQTAVRPRDRILGLTDADRAAIEAILARVEDRAYLARCPTNGRLFVRTHPDRKHARIFLTGVMLGVGCDRLARHLGISPRTASHAIRKGREAIQRVPGGILGAIRREDADGD